MYNTEKVLENETHKILWDSKIQTDHLISAWRPDLVKVKKKKRIYRNVNFVIPADHSVKLKKSEKRNKYLDLARELKKLWKMKMTVLAIVLGTLGTVTKGLVQGLEYLELRPWVETIQTASLRSTKILRKV